MPISLSHPLLLCAFSHTLILVLTLTALVGCGVFIMGFLITPDVYLCKHY